jgi:hypothetical protein
MTEMIQDIIFQIKSKKIQLDEIYYPMADWIQSKKGLTLVYVYQGGFFNVESGHYLDASLLFFTEKLSPYSPKELSELKLSILEQFPELKFDTKYHKAWNIEPNETVLLYSC